MMMDDLLADRQTQTRSGMLAIHSCTGSLHLAKALKNMLMHGRIDSNSGILHSDYGHQHSSFLVGPLRLLYMDVKADGSRRSREA
ncbi:hypothetical protein D1872_287900 [compost metagenome]